jgi:hypothetical protein
MVLKIDYTEVIELPPLPSTGFFWTGPWAPMQDVEFRLTIVINNGHHLSRPQLFYNGNGLVQIKTNPMCEWADIEFIPVWNCWQLYTVIDAFVASSSWSYAELEESVLAGLERWLFFSSVDDGAISEVESSDFSPVKLLNDDAVLLPSLYSSG